MKNSEMSEFVPDHLKLKKVCKHTVKKLPMVIIYVLDQYMCHKAILENSGTLKCVTDCYKTSKCVTMLLIITLIL